MGYLSLGMGVTFGRSKWPSISIFCYGIPPKYESLMLDKGQKGIYLDDFLLLR